MGLIYGIPRYLESFLVVAPKVSSDQASFLLYSGIVWEGRASRDYRELYSMITMGMRTTLFYMIFFHTQRLCIACGALVIILDFFVHKQVIRRHKYECFEHYV
jgi:hypothetical protein